MRGKRRLDRISGSLLLFLYLVWTAATVFAAPQDYNWYIRMIRADPELLDLPVILLTARAQESDVSTGFDSGADDYITKPFSPRELASRVETLLARNA